MALFDGKTHKFNNAIFEFTVKGTVIFLESKVGFLFSELLYPTTTQGESTTVTTTESPKPEPPTNTEPPTTNMTGKFKLFCKFL